MSDGRMNIPVRLAELLHFQDKAVVSQTLVKAKTGTVTLFAFDAGEGLSEHKAPFDALLFAVEGKANVAIGEAEYEINANEILQLPANIPHALHALSPFKMLLIMIRA